MDKPLTSMAYDDDELLDRLEEREQITQMPEMPEHPPHLECFCSRDDLEQLVDGPVAPDHTMRFAALGTVTGIMMGQDGECRIELSLEYMAGPDGQFCKMQSPTLIALEEEELEKLDLDAATDLGPVERGDMLHLIGQAVVTKIHDHEWGDNVTLQITHLEVEDESAENRGEAED